MMSMKNTLKTFVMNPQQHRAALQHELANMAIISGDDNAENAFCAHSVNKMGFPALTYLHRH